MGAKKLARRKKVKPFIKVVNYSHLFPTRYSVELEGLKGILSAESFKEPTQREDSKKQVKKLLEERYTGGKNKWFFQPLRVCGLFVWPFPSFTPPPTIPSFDFCPSSSSNTSVTEQDVDVILFV
jgi:hypothetical protein